MRSQTVDANYKFVNIIFVQEINKKKLFSIYLKCQDVDPVPVLTHKPEHFVLVGREFSSIVSCKWLTRADTFSPMKTLNIRKMNAVFEYGY